MAKPEKIGPGKYRIRWFDENGKRKSRVLESYAEARDYGALQENIAREIRLGLRPLPLPEHTFADVCIYWLENDGPLKKSFDSDQSIIRKHFIPLFGDVPLKKFGTEQADLLKVTNKASRKTLHNRLTLLITLMNKARDLGWIEKVPSVKKPKISSVHTNYSYLKTKEEIVRFLRAARQFGEVNYRLYYFAVCTGMRQGEIAQVKKSDIDLERRLITVVGTFESDETKNLQTRYVPIINTLHDELKGWIEEDNHPLLFRNRRGNMLKPSDRIFQEHLKKVLFLAGFPMKKLSPKPKYYITFHDLRHTFASHFAMDGGDLFRLQRILGHSGMTMTMRYSHLNPEAYASDLGRVKFSI